jgi:hypothetical protein
MVSPKSGMSRRPLRGSEKLSFRVDYRLEPATAMKRPKRTAQTFRPGSPHSWHPSCLSTVVSGMRDERNRAAESVSVSHVELDTLRLDPHERLSVAPSGRALWGGSPRPEDLGCSLRPSHGPFSLQTRLHARGRRRALAAMAAAGPRTSQSSRPAYSTHPSMSRILYNFGNPAQSNSSIGCTYGGQKLVRLIFCPGS